MEQPDQAAYLIVDSEHIEHPRMPLVPFIDGWETVEEMEAGARPARRARWPRRSTATTSTPRAARTPTSTSTPTGWRRRTPGPWGAYDLTLGKALYAGFTLGGIRTTVDGQVQRADGSVIAGLYAAGACASNIAQDGKGYCSGTQLGEGSFFGRRAGRHAAAVSPADR